MEEEEENGRRRRRRRRRIVGESKVYLSVIIQCAPFNTFTVMTQTGYQAY
jgi:hypothetical protein